MANRLFDVPIPRATQIDPAVYGQALAAPAVAREQRRQKLYETLAGLPAQVLQGVVQARQLKEKRKQTGLEQELLIAQTAETKAQALEREAKAKTMGNLKPRIQLRTIGNQLAAVRILPTGDIEVKAIGLSPQSASKIQEAQNTFATADSLLNTIRKLSDKVITAKGPLDLPGQTASITLGALTRSNPDAVAFTNSISAFASLLTRAAGEKGVLTTQDVQRILNSLPNRTDTVASARAKLDTLESLFEESKEAHLETLYTPLLELPKKETKKEEKPLLENFGIKFK